MKKILCALLTFVVAISLVSCKTEKQLATPANVKIDETGLITWDNVENAESYLIKINDLVYESFVNKYQYEDLSKNFTVIVTAKAKGYLESKPSEAVTYEVIVNPKPVVPSEDVKIGIVGSSEIKSGKSITLKANVTGTANTTVTWKITKGQNYASIDETGKVTALETDSDRIIEVTAISNADPTVKAKKTLTVVSRPILTQEMLDSITMDKISYEGYVTITVYSGVGPFATVEQTINTVIKTAMDGTNWYAEYLNGETGTTMGLFNKNHNNIASQVSVSLTNDEQYVPIVDKFGNEVTWADSGYYNTLKGLKVSDFKFNDSSWRWEYIGHNQDFIDRTIASCNPYDFETNNLALIIVDNEIMGLYSKSNEDYTIVEGKKSIQELTVALNYGDTVDVPTINKYKHNAYHDDLQTAINNMKALNSYTVDFKETTGSAMAPGYVESGFVEYITKDQYHFVPYTVTHDLNGREIHTPTENQDYGYMKIREDLYNTYYCFEKDKKATYVANRGYDNDFSSARPSFDFAPEIFTFEPVVNEKEGTKTYFVDDIMSRVASTFFYGVGNDINIYGIFATRGYISQTESFTPYVTIKDGYIVEAGFYFYMGSMYGVVELNYSNFNNCTLPEGTDVKFTTREIPTGWNELIIKVNDDPSLGEQDVNALEYFTNMFGSVEQANEVPFFGKPLGDTFGFGLSTIHRPFGSSSSKKSAVLYYDVPLDLDYTISSSIAAVDKYLQSLGFVKNQYDEYYKGDIYVYPSNSSLDLLIYVWKK